MEDFILMISNFFIGVFDVLSSINIRVLDFRIDFLGIIIGFLCFGIVCSLFWKGGKT